MKYSLDKIFQRVNTSPGRSERPNLQNNSWNNPNNKIVKIDLASPYPSQTLKQRELNRPRPVREYERFPKPKEPFGGKDHGGKLKEFFHKDIIAPLIRPSLYNTFDIKNPNFKHNELYQTKKNENTKWSVGVMCRPPDISSLPKKQPFTNYYFPPEYNNKDIEGYRSFSLKTDHIGIKVPKLTKMKSESEKLGGSFIKMKSDYCISTETMKENQWVPYPSKDSINNLSSKEYDIINFSPKVNNSANCQIMNKTLGYRKKGVGEYADLTKTYRVNVNPDFFLKYSSNPKRFRKFTGIFSNMYDASHKNGNIIPPFGGKKK